MARCVAPEEDSPPLQPLEIALLDRVDAELRVAWNVRTDVEAVLLGLDLLELVHVSSKTKTAPCPVDEQSAVALECARPSGTRAIPRALQPSCQRLSAAAESGAICRIRNLLHFLRGVLQPLTEPGTRPLIRYRVCQRGCLALCAR